MTFSFFLRRKVDPHAALRAALGDVELPSFPEVVMRALRAIREPDATVGRVGDILASDPGLSVGVLALANSAGAGAGRRIGNVRHAVALSGLSKVESLVLTAGVQTVLPRTSGGGFDCSGFWAAAARRAATARALAARLHPAQATESFTAALLQDMALPVLSQRRGRAYGEILEAWHGGEASLERMERERFGWDHGEVASWLCARWELPESLALAIGGHHGGEDGGDCPPAVALVGHLRETEHASGADTLVEDARARFGLPPEETLAAVNEGVEGGVALARLFA